MSQDFFLLAIDQGTTGSTALILAIKDGGAPEIVGRNTQEFPQHYPKPGWVSHDLNEIWQSVEKATSLALTQASQSIAGFAPNKVSAIGIANQRETLCVFDPKTGEPQTDGIVWQCKRSLEICQQLKADNHEALFRQRTGLVLDPYFSGSKMAWIMENQPAIAQSLKAGRSVWGTVDSYLLSRLTGGKVFATEPSNACRTLLYDIHQQCFDSELAEILKVPGLDTLPEVKNSAGIFGKTQGLSFLPDGIPISGILGDQQAALAGQTCFLPGEAKCTYGTGAFLVVNTGSEPQLSQNGLLTSLAWSLNDEPTYMLEGATFIAGAAVQFIRDQLHFVKNAAETEALAIDQIGAPEVYFVPSLSGLGAPYWNPEAQGGFFGLTRGTSIGQLTRACLEGIAFQVNDLIVTMNGEITHCIERLNVDGGAVANHLLMQSQADFSQITIDRPYILETTAIGAALFAGLGVGLYSDLNQIKNVRKSQHTFTPNRTSESLVLRQKCLNGWQKAVKATELFASG